ncbi:glycoside hydrolase family 92 protein [Melanomma pulvis-pyrius CBS 109.77]|uniref:Glycoside hydrolase family 92 protein n=1 Tax=Melanomma pulvis-pyrius CBS 109.77 TaxID=1314802 RepID=A0A6A6XMM4_9PLEO|nr:glycoside hydrolase family 92 protein [Melanomma pulvis-pyrius CBS 109.77]
MCSTTRLLAFIALLCIGTAAAADVDFTQYVNVFQGTTGGGNRFPGVVAAPFAMVKLGPDVQSGSTDAYSGYLPNGNIWGFSMMHESGTGGAPKYGVVSQMPFLGNLTNPLVDISQPRATADVGQVGYYKSSLSNGVSVELAATEHAGLYQYAFPSSMANSIVVDVSHVLPSFRGLGWEQHYSKGSFSFGADGKYEGSGTYNNGWNLSPDWTIYFCGRFNQKPTSSKTFRGTGTTLTSYDTTTSVSGTQRLGGVFTFASANITSRVGISYISTAKACQNVDNEIPLQTSLSSLVTKAKTRWNAEVFSKIQISSTNTADLQLLYSSMLGMFMIPSNLTGENPGWTSAEPYYSDIFTLWDTHRCHTSLFQIVEPVAYEEFVRSLIDIWRHDGYMPDARSSNFNGRVQGGSNADNVLADAYVKGVRGAINWNDGFAAMQTDAEKTPPNNNDPKAPDSSTKEGRGALPDWLKYGYITPAFTRAVSRAVEYSANDFGLYQVAKGLGKQPEAQKYLQRSRNWRNHWNPLATSNNHSGFVVPRLANGSFVTQDPLSCGGCYWGDAYYEDNPWVYSMNALHDVGELKNRIGGEDKFVDRIDKLFDLKIFSAGNEPGFTSPFLYNFVRGKQFKSVERSRGIGKLYNAGTGGLPGNSDAGAMESNILWQMIGLWPLTGQTTFLILSPWFSDMTIDLGTGKALKISATGGSKDTAFYVQSLRVNGQQWTKSWIAWQDVFANGGTMDFVLGPTPADWATGELPPSPASGDHDKWARGLVLS